MIIQNFLRETPQVWMLQNAPVPRSKCCIADIFAKAIQWIKDLFKRFCSSSTKPALAPPIQAAIQPPPAVIPEPAALQREELDRIARMDLAEVNREIARNEAWIPAFRDQMLLPPDRREPWYAGVAGNLPLIEARLAALRARAALIPQALDPIRELPQNVRDFIDVMDLEEVNKRIEGFDLWLAAVRNNIRQMEEAGDEAGLSKCRQQLEFAPERLAAFQARAIRLRETPVEEGVLQSIPQWKLSQLKSESTFLENCLPEYRELVIGSVGDNRTASQNRLDEAYAALRAYGARRNFLIEQAAPLAGVPAPADQKVLSKEEHDAIDLMNLKDVNYALEEFYATFAEANAGILQPNGDPMQIAKFQRRIDITVHMGQALTFRQHQLRNTVLSDEYLNELRGLNLQELGLHRRALILGSFFSLRAEILRLELGAERRAALGRLNLLFATCEAIDQIRASKQAEP